MEVSQRQPQCAPVSIPSLPAELRILQLHARKMNNLQRRYAAIAPAAPRQATPRRPRVTFYDLPAELRVEIYKLALSNVVIHILPLNPDEDFKTPPGLALASKQVRNEVLPMIHTLCPIDCAITDFNFDGILQWLRRIPPDEQSKLCKNEGLTIRFHTSLAQPGSSLESLRKWLHVRADKYRPQPSWEYTGVTPAAKVCADLRRRARRMKDTRKQDEMVTILTALKIHCGDDIRRRGDRRHSGLG